MTQSPKPVDATINTPEAEDPYAFFKAGNDTNYDIVPDETEQATPRASLLKNNSATVPSDTAHDTSTPAKQMANTGSEMPFISHLIELRTHLVRIIGAVAILFFSLVYFANDLYSTLSAPLRAQLPIGSHMISTDVTSGFVAPFKLTLFVAFFIAVPYILWQIWQFVAPALYKNEKRIAIPLLISSIILFYLGVAFAYFITLPSVLAFFVHTTPDSVEVMTDINSYLGFCMKLFLVFGVTFEIPIATLLLIITGIMPVQSLVDKRRYIIVLCFFVSMIVTPPDALSMLMLAIPMWLLFELGLMFGRVVEKSRAHSES